jgi:hypothetical protein
MRMRMVCFAVLAICLVFCAIPAHAQTEMMLTGSRCSSCFDFAASRSSLVLTLSESKPVLMTDSAKATDSDDFDRTAFDSGFGKGDLNSDYAPMRHHQRLEGDPVADRHRHDFDGDGDDDHDHHHHKFGGGPGGHVDPPPVSPTPEPMSMILFGTGLLVLGGTLRRRQRKVTI